MIFNKRKIIIIIMLFFIFSKLIISFNTVSAANNPPTQTSIYPVNNTTINVGPKTSCIVVDNDGDTMNATWYYNDYDDTLIIEENCSTFKNNTVWDCNGVKAGSRPPEPWNGAWYYNISSGEDVDVVARYLLGEVGYGYYYIKFKVSPQAGGEHEAVWFINTTTNDEADLWEPYYDNHWLETQSNFHYQGHIPGHENTSIWYNMPFDWRGLASWHELEITYNPDFCVIRMDNTIVYLITNGMKFGNPVNDFFINDTGTFFLTYHANGNSANNVQFIVDHIKITTGTWHQYGSDLF